MAEGPWGISWLRPQALFGLETLDPLVHAVFWSLFLNTATLTIGSLITNQSALERIQANLFINVFGRAGGRGQTFMRGSATANDLFFVAQRVLGDARAAAIFGQEARETGRVWSTLEPSPAFIGRLERELAGSIGAASAHVMLSKVVSGDAISLEEVMQMADETQQAIEYSQELEKTSAELRSTAEQLAVANRQLREVDQQKDDFLSQVSHEVRTPMTAIRAFTEILLDSQDLAPDQREKFISTIYKESLRLTTLLDEILDLSALERGERGWENQPVDAEAALDQAVHVCDALARQRAMTVAFAERAPSATVAADPNRFSQVLINLITNAIKYNSTEDPVVTIRSGIEGDHYLVEVSDNGPGIAKADRDKIFDKFYRGLRHGSAQTGAGLGLAISREIVVRMDGTLELVPQPGRGACFRVTLPLLRVEAVAEEIPAPASV
jgi:signal transduction histidine kinase